MVIGLPLQNQGMRVTRNRSKTFFGLQISGVLLLIVYLQLSINYPGLIPHTDHHHCHTDDEKAEQDPCHLTLYHPGAKGGCSHKFHLTTNCSDCQDNDLQLAYQTSAVNIPPAELATALPELTPNIAEGRIITYAVSHDNKGPPAIRRG